MTDYQFKAILKMVLDLLESNGEGEKTKNSLRVLIGDGFKENTGNKSDRDPVQKQDS